MNERENFRSDTVMIIIIIIIIIIMSPGKCLGFSTIPYCCCCLFNLLSIWPKQNRTNTSHPQFNWIEFNSSIIRILRFGECSGFHFLSYSTTNNNNHHHHHDDERICYFLPIFLAPKSCWDFVFSQSPQSLLWNGIQSI